MNRVLRTFLRASAVAGLLVSCNNDDIMPDKPEIPSNGYRLTFDGGVGIEQATRAHWSDERGSGNLIFNWDYTEEDAEPDEMVVGIFDGTGYLASTDGNYSTYAYIKRHGSKPYDAHWAKFETAQTYESEVPSGAYNGHQIIAVSPMKEDDNDSTLTSTAGEFIAEMPMTNHFVQHYSSSPDFLRCYMYMYALGEIVDGNATLAFNHIPATLRFIITNKRPKETLISSIKVATADYGAVASMKATITMDASAEEIVPVFSEESHMIMTLIAAELANGATYTAYALALPLADNTAFQGKQLLFSIDANDPDNEYPAFTLDAEKLADANKNYGDNIYNWVSGKSYTIRMSLNDVLTFEGISVADWTDGGTIDEGEAEESTEK